ncbi:cytochrome P450, family 78, subfamily A, polypeptide 5 [Tasmannia lanceolata]|uniref:cytochrome P450, family 78, subfamily A, polypeptide 5 n=1 Tax=Tasmannia lanceolata TaxID=3420 RepID=UPI00406399D0
MMSFDLDSAFFLLFFPKNLVGVEFFALALLFAAVFAFWLVPGGLAWGLTKVRKQGPINGPSGLPLVGLLFAFSGPVAHRALAKIAKTMDSVHLMAFSIGFTRFVISSHPDSAKEILNSSAFADRPVKESAYELLFHRAMGFAPFGVYWRNLRRISATHLFSPRRIAGFEGFRREIGEKMIGKIRVLMGERGEVDVKRVLHFGSLNNVMMSVFGKSYYDFEKGGEGFELEELVREGYDLLGSFNWSDHFPLIGLLDLQGVRKRCRNLVGRVNVFVGKIIEEHTKKVDGFLGEDGKDDFVDVLLGLEEDKLNYSDMIAVLWEMIFRGTDTVAILLEWILARMVLHPDIQSKAQSEIDTVVGNSRPVADSDIPNLPYLQSIVKESLRMHPPGPLLSWARLAIHDVHIGNNFIPAGTTAMVNMWSITHDKAIWTEPEEFKPERFMDEDVSVMGSDLRLAPFGSGRRVCPGKAMGLATVHLWLAQLLKEFKFLPTENGVSLDECLKMSLEMKSPLVCRAVPRS